MSWSKSFLLQCVLAGAVGAAGCNALWGIGDLSYDAAGGTTAAGTGGQGGSPTGGGGTGGGSDDIWQYRRRLTLDLGVDATITHFPILVRIAMTTLGAAAASAGADLRFTDAAGSPLPHEIEYWSEASGAVVWVRATELTQVGGSRPTLWMYYGNPRAPDGQDPVAVWQGGFRGVWHLGDEGDSLVDSSGNNLPAVSFGATRTAALFGFGRGFDATNLQYVETGNAEQLPTFTIEAWVRSPQAPDILSGPNGPLSRDQNYQLSWDHSDTFAGSAILRTTNDNWVSVDLRPLSPDTWYYLAATYENGELVGYKDGVEVGRTSAGPPQAETATARIGAHAVAGNPASYFTGTIDEVRICNVARSGNWIFAQHNATSRFDFVTFGDEEGGPFELP